MKKNVAGCLIGSIVMLISIPISMFIQYSMLKQINVSDFVWFAFWFYWPLVFTTSLLLEVVKGFMEDK